MSKVGSESLHGKGKEPKKVVTARKKYYEKDRKLSTKGFDHENQMYKTDAKRQRVVVQKNKKYRAKGV